MIVFYRNLIKNIEIFLILILIIYKSNNIFKKKKIILYKVK